MIKDSFIEIRINSQLKFNVTEIANKRGVSLSRLIEAFLLEINERKTIPLNINRHLPPVYDAKPSIAKIKQKISEVIEKYEKKDLIKKVFLFGSYSRGEETGESDIDLRMEADEGFHLFDLSELSDLLEEALDKQVDLYIEHVHVFNEEFLNSIKKDEICVYEKA